ncbi:AraC family transcriptional regulator [Shewanella sp. 1_MG-2023]|uniref:AraC family transcriptional regulator n=1 Tax=unclassified Shewanella TaxID=196818 RepID=UPI0026E2258E|nr:MULTISPECIES: AraC family transcriptional regulator [unclassified Shewanella]MDO6613855.1 AraC family transcriptional regulator [Shewanella sp. 7_MG-2023]MDO6770047.1 AraC family transcriptional regulator [Shewanella sp. 2_MG-2023]MDO6795422.1 AraC family transcriptional regulator [Shewanella sp. 1_MG-2023]
MNNTEQGTGQGTAQGNTVKSSTNFKIWLTLGLFIAIFWSAMQPSSALANADNDASANAITNGNGSADSQSQVASELENIKSQVIKLNRDLFILEEDLLFPASTQIAVFVSVDIGRFFTLDSVELKINQQNVAGFLYTQRQRRALEKGGIQKVYMGNLKMGQHQLTAIFTGVDAEGRTVQRAVTHQFEKTDETVMVELKLEDNESSYRADVKVEEWVL